MASTQSPVTRHLHFAKLRIGSRQAKFIPTLLKREQKWQERTSFPAITCEKDLSHLFRFFRLFGCYGNLIANL